MIRHWIRGDISDLIGDTSVSRFVGVVVTLLVSYSASIFVT